MKVSIDSGVKITRKYYQKADVTNRKKINWKKESKQACTKIASIQNLKKLLHLLFFKFNVFPTDFNILHHQNHINMIKNNYYFGIKKANNVQAVLWAIVYNDTIVSI